MSRDITERKINGFYSGTQNFNDVKSQKSYLRRKSKGMLEETPKIYQRRWELMHGFPSIL